MTFARAWTRRLFLLCLLALLLPAFSALTPGTAGATVTDLTYSCATQSTPITNDYTVTPGNSYYIAIVDCEYYLATGSVTPSGNPVIGDVTTYLTVTGTAFVQPYDGGTGSHAYYTLNFTAASLATPSVAVSSSDSGTNTEGTPVTYTANVTGSGSTPTGTVTFYDGSTAICSTVALASGVATCQQTYNSTTGSPHAITASYSGDGNYSSLANTADTTSVTETVHLVPSISVTSSNNGAGTVGVQVTYTANVTGSGSTPTGTVTFYDGSTAICSAVALSSGVATCQQTYNSTTGSPHAITASYSGDGTFNSVAHTADTTSISEAISPGAAQVAVSSSDSGTNTEGTPVTYTANVTGSGSTPTGTVTFYDGSTAICSTVALASGVATCQQTYNSTTGSPHAITASYSGDGNYNSVAHTADTTTVTETVHLTASVVVTSSNNGAGTVGVQVTYTANVTGSGSTPTGTVTFYDGSTAICSAVALSSGVATCQQTYNSTTGSPHAITASYSGDGTFNSVAHTADTTSISEAISPGAAQVAVSSSDSGTNTEGTPVTYTANVTGSGSTPTGTVTFYDGSTAICSTVALASGVATCQQTYNSTTGSPHAITASYSGDGNYNSVAHTADTTTVTETVHLTASVVVTSSNNGAGTVGVQVTYTANVTGSGSTPTGTVTFYDGSTAICSAVALSSGSVTCQQTYNSTTGSPHAITASYSGDGTFNSVAHTADTTSVSESVGVATASVVVTSSNNGAGTVGVQVTYTANVTGSGSTPTGTVTFYDGSTALCSTVSLASGVATCQQTYNSTTGSPHTITASYSGDGNYNAVANTADVMSVNEAVTVASPRRLTPTSPVNDQTTLVVTTTTQPTGGTLMLAVSGGSGTGGVTFTLLSAGSAHCFLQGDVLVATQTGSCTISATKAGSSTYLAATSAPTVVSFVVATTTTPTPWRDIVGSFAVGSTTVSSPMTHEIEVLGTLIVTHRYRSVVLKGFASPGGASITNMHLSRIRALNVAELLKHWLASRGITDVTVSYKGEGVTTNPAFGSGRVVVVQCLA